MYYLKVVFVDGVELDLESCNSMGIYQAIDIFRTQNASCFMSVRSRGYIGDFADDYRLDIL